MNTIKISEIAEPVFWSVRNMRSITSPIIRSSIQPRCSAKRKVLALGTKKMVIQERRQIKYII